MLIVDRTVALADKIIAWSIGLGLLSLFNIVSELELATETAMMTRFAARSS
jgi:hypothetical protein